MTKKVHPNASFKWSAASSNANVSTSQPFYYKASNDNGTSTSILPCIQKDNNVVALTVWKKSLLMNCNGFTVFDNNGNIVFRVDNYVADNRAEIVLMDAGGKPLLTIRRKWLSWGDNWLIYEGESTANPRYSVHKQASFLANNKNTTLAQVFISPSRSNKEKSNSGKLMLYQIEGSYAQRNVTVYNNKRQCVAQIKRKEAQGGVALGGDVFKLIIVRPDDIDSALAMALVILLDQMF